MEVAVVELAALALCLPMAEEVDAGAAAIPMKVVEVAAKAAILLLTKEAVTAVDAVIKSQ
jgi:hypothetical protein